MGRSRKCEICNIRAKDSEKLLFAKFPLTEHICKQWIKAVGKEDLVYLPIEKLHDLRYVCGNHFGKRDFTKSKTRLKKNAIPKLGLKLTSLPDELLEGFPLHMAGSSKALSPVDFPHLREHDYSKGIKRKLDEFTGPSPKKSRIEESQLEGTKRKSSDDLAPSPKKLRVEETHAATKRKSSDDLAPSPKKLCVEETHAATKRKSSDDLGPSPKKSRIEESQLEGTKRKSSDDLAPSPKKLRVEETHAATKRKSSDDLAPSPKKLCVEETHAATKRKSSDDLELTPRKRKLMEDLRKTRCTVRSLRKSALLIEKIESPVLKEIVINAQKNQTRKPKGRRWTMKNKISALAIYKRSPKTYRYLNQVLPLPTQKTLQNMLKKVPIEPGINKSVLLHLKKIAPKKQEKDKVCCLLFDEMAIKPRLILNTSNQIVEGYEDLGELGRTGEVADHALVFMLQGLHQKYKQPIAFYFTKGTISSSNLANIIKMIISQVSSCGFKILNTVCDQGSTNIGALKLLRQGSGEPHPDGSDHYFIHNGEKVFIVYDVPHLFKSLRNNFLKHGRITICGKTGEWAHLLEVEKENRSFLYLSKISETHVNPKYKAKMRVKFAAQILSNTVAAILKLLSRGEKNQEKRKRLLNTALVVQELDGLFDVTNGPSGPNDKKPKLRDNVSNRTNHLNTWANWIYRMNSIKFTDQNGKPAKNVKCVQGYITTLKSLRDIWSHVNKMGFKYLNLRQLNQDALENLFGLLRQHSPTNRHPTAAHFVGALKAATITKMSAPQMRGTNCEKDKNFLLTGFESVVFSEADKENEKSTESVSFTEEGLETTGYPVASSEDEYPVISIPEEAEDTEDIEQKLVTISGQATVYVSGYLASRFLKRNSCEKCKDCLSESNPEGSLYDYTSLREWWPGKLSLTYPTFPLCKLVHTATEIVENEVVNILHQKNIIDLTVTLIEANCDLGWFTCDTHRKRLLKLMLWKIAVLLLRRACQKRSEKFVTQEETLADAYKKAEQQGKAK